MSATQDNYELISRVEQFYFREARMLDERRFQQWLQLLDPEIEYSVPGRCVPQPDARQQGTEDFLSVEHELDRANGGQGSPIRLDRYMQLMIRTMRPFKANAWADSPPPRTRRFISNVEVEAGEDEAYRVHSNFQMFYSHDGGHDYTYTGGRRDVLRCADGQFRIVKREVIPDWEVIAAPTMALIF